MKRRISSAILALLLICLAAVSTPAVAAQSTENTEKDTILIAFSDFQGEDGVKTSERTLQKMLTKVWKDGMKHLDAVFALGDYNAGNNGDDESAINTNMESMKAIRRVFGHHATAEILFARGDRDSVETPGLASDGNNDPVSGAYGAYIIPVDQYGAQGSAPSETKKAAADLKAYLDAKADAGFKKPIFILNHAPLHWGNRTLADGTGLHAYLLFDVLNEAGAKGLNIIYLFGHNNSGGYDDFLGGPTVYLKKGDEIEIAQGANYDVETEILKFTYMNAGYINYSPSEHFKDDDPETFSVFLIRGNELYITRYDVNGVHRMKSRGVWHPDFSDQGYHATPNDLQYSLSRRVTADDDVHVVPPEYSVSVTTTTTTTWYPYPPPTFTTFTSKSASATTKSSVTKSTTMSATAVTTAPTIAAADPTQPATDPVDTTTTTAAAVTEPEQNGAAADTTPDDEKKFPIGLVIGGGVLVVAVVIALLVIKRKK